MHLFLKDRHMQNGIGTTCQSGHPVLLQSSQESLLGKHVRAQDVVRCQAFLQLPACVYAQRFCPQICMICVWTQGCLARACTEAAPQTLWLPDLLIIRCPDEYPDQDLDSIPDHTSL